ncbi:glycosyltransferase [Acuticoccus kandeliae]|uniref:glycosyltransferase n=1 Tax=Acuticoccus kandeliae TaxID=2073160 RepID=UPI00147416BC|nr:glycosyltransferase [Acuticoccus kandeliae]
MTTECTGGTWTYAMDLAEGLAAYDVEVTLFVSGGPLTLQRMVEAGLHPNLRLVRSELKLEWMNAPEADLAETDAILRDLAAEIRPDIIHINGYANAAAGFDAPVVSVAHSCVATRWRAVHGAAAPWEWDAYRTRLRRGVAAADCLVAPTAAHLKAFCAEHGEPRNARVIHNGRSDSFQPEGEKVPFALAAGRFWDEGKNLSILREVAPLTRYPIALIGEMMSEQEQAASLPSESGITPPTARGLTTFGRVDAPQLEHTMAQASVFVAPARYEPFGLAVLEAARAKMALVLGDIPTMRELWDGVARFAPPNDAEAFAAAIDALLDDPAAAASEGAAARDRAIAYSMVATTRAYMDLYTDLSGVLMKADATDTSPFGLVP